MRDWSIKELMEYRTYLMNMKEQHEKDSKWYKTFHKTKKAKDMDKKYANSIAKEIEQVTQFIISKKLIG